MLLCSRGSERVSGKNHQLWRESLTLGHYSALVFVKTNFLFPWSRSMRLPCFCLLKRLPTPPPDLFPLVGWGPCGTTYAGCWAWTMWDNEPNLRLIQAYLLLVLDPAYPHSLQKMGPFSARSAVAAADCLFLFEGGSIFLFLPALSLNRFRLTSSDLTHLGSQACIQKSGRAGPGQVHHSSCLPSLHNHVPASCHNHYVIN